MTAPDRLRRRCWDDAMARWMRDVGLPEPGTALMPPVSMLRHGAVPVSIASHAETVAQCSTTVIRNHST